MEKMKINDYNFTIVNNETKKGKSLVRSYYNAEEKQRYNLDSCYNNYSNKKEKAFKECLKIMKELNGVDGYISSFNIHRFTYSFKLENDLIVINECNNYIIENVF